MKFAKSLLALGLIMLIVSCQNTAGDNGDNGNTGGSTGGDTGGGTTDPSKPAGNPVFNFSSGAYWGSIELKITADNATTIYYTTDGSVPSSTSYSSLVVGSTPITVSSSCTVKAIAVNAKGTASATTSASYTIDKYASTPSVSLNSGAYNTAQTVTVNADDNTVVRYTVTTDGTTPADPTASDPVCNATISLPAPNRAEVYYKYKFKAFTTANDPAIPRSAATESYVMSRDWKMDTLPPNPPTGLAARCYSSGAIYLTWDTAVTGSDTTKYATKYGQGSTVTNATINWQTPSSSSSGILTGLSNDVCYAFAVRAIDEAGNYSDAAACVTRIPLNDYASWGSYASVSQCCDNPSDASCSFVRVGTDLVMNAYQGPYIGMNGLDAYDASITNAIHRVTRGLDKAWKATASKGSTLYGLNDNSNGVDVVDISTPRAPIVGKNLPAEQYSKICVSDDEKYLAIGLPSAKKVAIYDISSPLAPSLLASIAVTESTSNLKSINLSEGILTLDCSSNGIEFYSFTAPGTLALLGSYAYCSDSSDEFICQHNGYAIFGRTGDAKVTVRKISALSTVVVSTSSIMTDHSPRRMGNCLYAVANRSNLNDSGDLYVWDISSPSTLSSPTKLAGVVPPMITFKYLSRLSATEYVVWDSTAGRGCVANVSTPLSPTFGATFTFSFKRALSRVSGNDVVYLAQDENNDLFAIKLDISDRSAERVTQYLPLGKPGNSYFDTDAANLVKAGDYYYAIVNNSLVSFKENSDGSLASGQPIASSLTLSNNPNRIAVNGTLLAIKGSSSVVLVDVSSPMDPALTATISPPFSRADGVEKGSLAFSGNTLFISSGDQLAAYNVSNASSPSLLNTIAYGSSGFTSSTYDHSSGDITFAGTVVYVDVSSNYNHRLIAVNAANPSQLTVMGSTPSYNLNSSSTDGSYTRLYVSGNYCFAIDPAFLFEVIDVQDPATPNAFSLRKITGSSNNHNGSLFFDRTKFVCVEQNMNIDFASN